MTTTSARLLAMLSLLQARRDWPAPALAERLDVSPRTIRRDVDRLREIGYPIASTKGPDGGYRLDAGSELPPLLFDDDQAVALAVALQTATASGAGIAESAARALTTIRQVMPSRLRHRIDAVSFTSIGQTDEVDPKVLTSTMEAVRACEVLRFDYTTTGSTGGSTGDEGAVGRPRRVEPHHVVARNGRWYLVAWDLDRADWRTFRVDRITPRVPNGPRFSPRELPGGADVNTYVSGVFRGAAPGSSQWPCRGEVLVRTAMSEIAPYVGDFGDTVVEQHDEDSCRVVMGAWSWAGLAARFGQFDADIAVIGPPQLRDAFEQLAVRFAAAAG